MSRRRPPIACSRAVPSTACGITTPISTQQFFAGRWSSTRGKWRVRYTETELCVITVGKVVLVSDDGARNAFQQGDAFVVPAGFIGQLGSGGRLHEDLRDF